jgi:hypothetical protein
MIHSTTLFVFLSAWGACTGGSNTGVSLIISSLFNRPSEIELHSLNPAKGLQVSYSAMVHPMLADEPSAPHGSNFQGLKIKFQGLKLIFLG